MLNHEFHFIKPKSVDKSILIHQNMLFQEKFDGISIECFIDSNNNIELFGRGVTKGKDSNFTKQFPELVDTIERTGFPASTNFLAEAIIKNNNGKQDCGLVAGRSHRTDNIDYYAKINPANLIVHDVIKVGGINCLYEPYETRLHQLQKHIIFNHLSSRLSIIDNYTDGIMQWEFVKVLGKEGLIIRNPNSPVGEGIFKLKREITEDVYCIGEHEMSTSATYSTIKYISNGEERKGVFANLKCYQLKEGKEIYVGDVSGFSNSDKIKIQIMLNNNEITKEKPLVLEIKAFDRHPSGKFKSPNFLRIRTDKSWKDCIITETVTAKKNQKYLGDY